MFKSNLQEAICDTRWDPFEAQVPLTLGSSTSEESQALEHENGAARTAGSLFAHPGTPSLQIESRFLLACPL